eukprot:SAG31_NODE_3730_length_3943_cov_2.667274_2_plen_750_part_00
MADSDSEDEFADAPGMPEPAVHDPVAQLQEWQVAAFGRDKVADTVEAAVTSMIDTIVQAHAGRGPRALTTQAIVLRRLRNTPTITAGQLTLSPLAQRRVIERQFPLITVNMLDQCSYHPSMAQRHDIRVHADNARRGIISKPRLHRGGGEWREEQLQLLAANAPAKMRALLDQRRQQVYESLSSGYQRVRVAVIAIYVSFTMEVLNEWPFRTHWPEDRGEDELMLDFITYLSIRYTSFACVKAALGHVIEFHFSFLRVSPPPLGFPRTRWFLNKLKLTMAKEKPEGRKRRPGLPGRAVHDILGYIRQLIDSVRSGSYMQKLYVNVGAAVAFAFEQSMRVGNVCPGQDFRSDWHLSRETIKGALRPVEDLRRQDWLVVQAPVSKTTFTSAAARERTTRPRLVDTQCTKMYGFVNWGALLQQYDPASDTELPGNTPAFRMGGAGSPALSYHQTCRILKLAAVETVPNWRDFDYGGHSLRIGRVNDMLAARTASGERMADDEQINSWSMHTATAGRAGYDRSEIQKDLKLMRAAEETHVRAIEAIQAFPQNRGAHRTVVTGTMRPPERVTQQCRLCDSEFHPSPCTKDPSTTKQFCDQCWKLQKQACKAQIATVPLDLQATLEQDEEVAATVDLLDNPPDWEGAPVKESDMHEIQEESASDSLPAKRRANSGTATNDTKPKQRKYYDFRTGQWATAPPSRTTPTEQAETCDRLRKNLCEICALRTKNYGIRGGRRRWCGACGKSRGATLHCA